MSYNNYHLDRNRYTARTTQSVLKTTLIFAEEAIKFLANFAGSMIRMVMGK